MNNAFKKIYFILFYVYLCLPTCMYVCLVPDSCGGQKRVSGPLQLEFPTGISYQVDSGTEPGSSARAAAVENSITLCEDMSLRLVE